MASYQTGKANQFFAVEGSTLVDLNSRPVSKTGALLRSRRHSSRGERHGGSRSVMPRGAGCASRNAYITPTSRPSWIELQEPASGSGTGAGYDPDAFCKQCANAVCPSEKASALATKVYAQKHPP